MRLSDFSCEIILVPHCNKTMEVFAVTIFMSLLFAVLFAVLFFAERSQRDRAGIEQMALLPLDDGPVTKPVAKS